MNKFAALQTMANACDNFNPVSNNNRVFLSRDNPQASPNQLQQHMTSNARAESCLAGKAHLKARTLRLVHIPGFQVRAPVCHQIMVVVVVFCGHLWRLVVVRLIHVHNLPQG